MTFKPQAGRIARQEEEEEAELGWVASERVSIRVSVKLSPAIEANPYVVSFVSVNPAKIEVKRVSGEKRTVVGNIIYL